MLDSPDALNRVDLAHVVFGAEATSQLLQRHDPPDELQTPGFCSPLLAGVPRANANASDVRAKRKELKKRLLVRQRPTRAPTRLEDLLPWQLKVVDLLRHGSHEQQPHPFWLRNQRGHVGKSTLATFLCERLDGLILTAADEADVLEAIHDDFVTNVRKGRLICIMDVPRAAGATAPHQTIEKLLSGRLVDTKHVGDDVCVDPCIDPCLTSSSCSPTSPPKRRAPGQKTASTRTTRSPPSSASPDSKRSATSAAPTPTERCGRGTDHDAASSKFHRDVAKLPKDELEEPPCCKVALDAAAAADGDDDVDVDVDDDDDQDLPEVDQDPPECGDDGCVEPRGSEPNGSSATPVAPQTPTSGPVNVAAASPRGNPGKQARDDRHIAVATRRGRPNHERARSPLGNVPVLNHGGIDFDDAKFGPEDNWTPPGSRVAPLHASLPRFTFCEHANDEPTSRARNQLLSSSHWQWHKSSGKRSFGGDGFHFGITKETMAARQNTL